MSPVLETMVFNESGRPCDARKKASVEEALPVLMENRGTLMRNTMPFGSRPGEKGTRTRTGRTDTGRTVVGRAGSFNPDGSGPGLHGKNGYVLNYKLFWKCHAVTAACP